MTTAFIVFPDDLYDSGRPARWDWDGCSAAVAVTATIKASSDAIVRSVRSADGQTVAGHLPGGLG